MRSLSRFSAPHTGDHGDEEEDGDADYEDHVTVETVWFCVTIMVFLGVEQRITLCAKLVER